MWWVIERVADINSFVIKNLYIGKKYFQQTYFNKLDSSICLEGKDNKFWNK